MTSRRRGFCVTSMFKSESGMSMRTAPLFVFSEPSRGSAIKWKREGRGEEGWSNWSWNEGISGNYDENLEDIFSTLANKLGSPEKA